MTHEDVLNALLANACPSTSDEESENNGGVKEYMVELHCASFLVKAKPLGNLKYEVMGLEKMG